MNAGTHIPWAIVTETFINIGRPSMKRMACKEVSSGIGLIRFIPVHIDDVVAFWCSSFVR